MPLERDETLKKAEQLLRQGRLEAAILEYARVVEDYPRDWLAANTLGDLCARTGQVERAAAQYTRLAEHFRREGFYAKAAALYKKLLKLDPEDESALLNLAEVSETQGLLADARLHLEAVAARRRRRGDESGEAEIFLRLVALDAPPEDEPAAAPAESRGAGAAPAAVAAPARRADLASPPSTPDNAIESTSDAVPGPVPSALDEAFRDLRARATASQDALRHLTLGRSYLDAGMLDEARSALEIASRFPGLRFEAASLLGRVHASSGDTPRAIEWLERAAEAPAPDEEAGRAVLYDLGTLYEATGETARALALFLELQIGAGEYRDLAARIERITRAQSGG